MKTLKSYLIKQIQNLWLMLTATCSFIFFRILNRTRIYGLENLPRGRNVLLVSNHRTMIDSFLIGMAAYFPRGLRHPGEIPYNPAAVENFFEPRLLGLCSWGWRCIPVDRSRPDLQALRTIMKTFQHGNVLLFPEGTRSRNGELSPAKESVGMIIREARPTVVPVYLAGVEEVLPIGCRNPRLGKKISVTFGKELELEPYLTLPRRECASAMSQAVMASIRELKENREGLPAGATTPPQRLAAAVGAVLPWISATLSPAAIKQYTNFNKDFPAYFIGEIRRRIPFSVGGLDLIPGGRSDHRRNKSRTEREGEASLPPSGKN